jgi:hypothetical protein
MDLTEEIDAVKLSFPSFSLCFESFFYPGRIYALRFRFPSYRLFLVKLLRLSKYSEDRLSVIIGMVFFPSNLARGDRQDLGGVITLDDGILGLRRTYSKFALVFYCGATKRLRTFLVKG